MDKTAIAAKTEAETYTIKITSNRDWTVYFTSDNIGSTLCYLEGPQYGSVNGEVKITLTANPMLEKRTADVFISAAGAAKQHVTVTHRE